MRDQLKFNQNNSVREAVVHVFNLFLHITYMHCFTSPFQAYYIEYWATNIMITANDNENTGEIVIVAYSVVLRASTSSLSGRK
jgi:hypothetical protein